MWPVCENVSTRNELATDFTKGVLKLAIVSAGCSMLSDKADANACLESALEETDKSKEDTKRKLKNKLQALGRLLMKNLVQMTIAVAGVMPALKNHTTHGVYV